MSPPGRCDSPPTNWPASTRPAPRPPDPRPPDPRPPDPRPPDPSRGARPVRPHAGGPGPPAAPPGTRAARPAGEREASVRAARGAAAAPGRPGGGQLSLGGGRARPTVTTILPRLHDKGIVERRREGRGYAYYPVQDASGLTARRMHSEL